MIISTVRNTAVLTPGWHKFSIADVEVMYGENGQYLKLTCTLLKKDETPSTATMLKNLSLGTKARFFFEQFIDALDLPESDEFDTDSLVGCKFKGLIAKKPDGKYFEFVEFAKMNSDVSVVTTGQPSLITTVVDTPLSITQTTNPAVWA